MLLLELKNQFALMVALPMMLATSVILKITAKHVMQVIFVSNRIPRNFLKVVYLALYLEST
ncbi:hypothetical protein PPE_06530 [Paenibacillus polymyxa E681]|nr:hypothetical protein PPE_06530 [Paenibacillus polymyxa E681]